MITNFGKEKKRSYSKDYFIFITMLSFAGVLVDWVVVVAEDVGPLPLDSSLAGMRKVAKTSSWLWETTLPSKESLGVVGGFVISGATSFRFSFSFSAVPACSAPFGGLLGGGRSLAGISLVELEYLGAASSGEIEESSAWIAGQ